MNIVEAYKALKDIDKKNRRLSKKKRFKSALCTRKDLDDFDVVFFKRDLRAPISKTDLSALDLFSNDWEVVDPEEDSRYNYLSH